MPYMLILASWFTFSWTPLILIEINAYNTGFSFLKLVGAQGTTHLTYATCVITAPKNFAPATY